MPVPDSIRKHTLLRAPLAKVWSAISDSSQFGTWFGAEFDGPFVAGQRVAGRIRPTKVDPEVAKLQEPVNGKPFEVLVERVEAPHHLSFRWHVDEPEPGAAPESVPMTLVSFELSEAEGGTLLEITESGFDRVSLEKRAALFARNEGGWEHQLKLIAKYLDGHAA